MELEILKQEFENFKIKNGNYPATLDITTQNGFSFSAKTIQRRMGGIVNIRKNFGLEITDFTKGSIRADKALASNNKSFIEQEKIYKKLRLIFGEYYIHQQSPYGDFGRQRSDFKIHHKQGHLYIDIFYANRYESMVGCINAKLKKFNPDIIWGDIILVNTNKLFNDRIPKLIEQRKTPLPKNIKVMSEQQLFDYLSNLTAIKQWT